MTKKEKMFELIELENMKDYNPYCSNDNCKYCSDIDECYLKATVLFNHEFAQSINYGGYDSEEEFWDNLL